jgi:hypothetical protein
MVSKHKNIPKKSKYVRGGGGLEEIIKSFVSDEEKIREWTELKMKELQQLVNNINTSLGNNKVETYGSNMSDEEIEEIVKVFKSKIKMRVDNTFREKVCNNQDDKSKLYQDFDIIFLSILTTINKNIIKLETNRSEPFKKIINLLKLLPGIKENLETIVDISSFTDRFKKIIELLQNECGPGIFKSLKCGAALKTISLGSGNDSIQKLYDYLFTLPINKICDTDLIKFIKDVIPIIQTNLEGVTDFEDDLKGLTDLQTANKELLNVAVGGKKSSRAGRKEIHGKQKKIYIKSNYKNKDKDIVAKTSDKPVIIAKKIILGKERCIYKIQGSKREHVKYKGSIITVTDYKKLMKAL